MCGERGRCWALLWRNYSSEMHVQTTGAQDSAGISLHGCICRHGLHSVGNNGADFLLANADKFAAKEGDNEPRYTRIEQELHA